MKVKVTTKVGEIETEATAIEVQVQESLVQESMVFNLQDVKQQCEDGQQNCHVCNLLNCGDNTALHHLLKHSAKYTDLLESRRKLDHLTQQVRENIEHWRTTTHTFAPIETPPEPDSWCRLCGELESYFVHHSVATDLNCAETRALDGKLRNLQQAMEGLYHKEGGHLKCLKEMHKRLAELDFAVSGLRQEVQTAKLVDERKAIHQNVIQLRDQLAELQTLKKTAAGLRKDITSIDKDLTKLDDRVDDVAGYSHDLEDTVTRHDKELAELRVANQNRVANVIQLRDQLAELQKLDEDLAKLVEVEKETKLLRKAVTDLADWSHTVDNKIAALQGLAKERLPEEYTNMMSPEVCHTTYADVVGDCIGQGHHLCSDCTRRILDTPEG